METVLADLWPMISATVIGIVIGLVPKMWDLLETLVKKTPTTLDDQLLAKLVEVIKAEAEQNATLAKRQDKE